MCVICRRAFVPRFSTWVVGICFFVVAGQLEAQPFSARRTINTADTADGRAIVAGDIDDDGLPDVVAVAKGDGKVSYYINQGGSPVSFGSQGVIANKGSGGRGVALGDIDGDGDLDAVAGFDDSAPDIVKAIYWYENDLDNGMAPTFSTETEIVTAVDCAWLVLEDIDKDGDLDVVAALRKDNNTAWFANPRIGANTTWTETNVHTSVAFAFFVDTGDIDGDGDEDVGTAAFSGSTLVWNRNGDFSGGPTGAFGSEKVIQSPFAGASAIQLVNWDNDGDVDAIGAGDTADEVTAYSSGGGVSPVWTPTIIASVAAGDAVEGPTGLFAGDISGNTFADALVASRFSGSLVYIQNNSGTWATPTTVDSALTEARSSYAFDLDNDGDLDLLSAASLVSGGGFFWYENERPSGCPMSGEIEFEDTHCTSLTTSVAPPGNEVGDFTFLAAGIDDSADTVLYRFEAALQGGGTLVRDYLATDTATFTLSPGDWDVKVVVDDDLGCADTATDNTCTLATFTVTVDCPDSGELDFEDTLCTSFAITAEPGGDLEGSYTVTSTASDDSGDTPEFTFLADRDNGQEILQSGPSTTAEATFPLGPGDWELTCVVDDNPNCPDDAAGATCTPINRYICAIAGDSHCTGLTIFSEPGGGVEGLHEFDANATDDSGDSPLIYTFTANRDLGAEILVIGPQNDDDAIFDFTVGSWVVTVVVDDEAVCADVAGDNFCEITVDVTVPECPVDGDTHCDSFALSSDPGGIPGTYTFDATSTDDGGDSPLIYNYQAVRDGGAETLNDSNSTGTVDFDFNTPGSWEVSVMVDDDPACGDVAPDATCDPVTVLVCPAAGDSHCDSLARTAGPTDPNGINPGSHTFTTASTDDSGDSPLIYEYTANRDSGAEVLTSGPTNANSFDFDLDNAGSWDVSVVVDDDADCDDEAGDNSCLITIEVVDPCPIDGDSHCTTINQESGPAGNAAGDYTVRINATDDSGDQLNGSAAVTIGGGEIFQIDSFFDVFFDIDLTLTDGEYAVNAAVDDDSICLDEATDAACTPLVITVVSAAPNRGLQGAFDFEDAELGADGYLGLFDGTNTGVVSGPVRGDSGTADFGTTADEFRIDLPEDPRLTPQSPFTIAAFVKLPTPNDAATIYGEVQAGPTELLLQVLGTSDGGDEGLPQLRTVGGGIVTSVRGTTRVDDDEWHHVAGVIRGDGSLAMYVDGVLEGSEPGPIGSLAGLFGDGSGPTIGTIEGAGDDYFGGLMDDLAVYSVELTLEEIQELSSFCPLTGDTHCDGISITVPADNAPGTYTIDANATDDTGDTILYSYEAVQGGTVLTDGPTTSSSTSFSLTEGAWDITVTVDDDGECEDVAGDSSCSTSVDVCPGAGDTHCTGVQLSGPAQIDSQNVPGTYTASANSSDDSGDAIMHIFTADNGIDAPIVVGPQEPNSTDFNLDPGSWTISVSVDDDGCADVASDATCDTTIDVADVGLQLPGDINGDGDKDLSDAIALARFLFVDPDARLACGNGLRDDPANAVLFDWNGDSTINLADVVATLDWLFMGGLAHDAGGDCLLKPGCPDTSPCPAP